MDILIENKKRDVFLLGDGEDKNNVFFIPMNWPTEEDEDEGMTILCYAPTYIRANSPIDTLWVSVARLSALKEITEEEARRIHPALFKHLAKIDAGQPEDTGCCTCAERQRRAPSKGRGS